MAFKMKGFKAHDMFEPETGKKVVANTYQEHLDLGKKGYKHKSPKKNLRQWFAEEWKDEKGNVCGSDKNKNTKVCRPSKRVNKNSPKPWSEMTKAEKNKVIAAKKRAGMGRRRDSSSNVA